MGAFWSFFFGSKTLDIVLVGCENRCVAVVSSMARGTALEEPRWGRPNPIRTGL